MTDVANFVDLLNTKKRKREDEYDNFDQVEPEEEEDYDQYDQVEDQDQEQEQDFENANEQVDNEFFDSALAGTLDEYLESSDDEENMPRRKKRRTEGTDMLRFWDPDYRHAFKRVTEPLAHQKFLLEWAQPVLEKHGCLLIGDGMGLGKTLENMLLAQTLMTNIKDDQALIVCPKSVMDEWFDQLGKHYSEAYPNMRVFKRGMNAEDLQHTQLVMCTVQQLLRVTGYSGSIDQKFMQKIHPDVFSKYFPNDKPLLTLTKWNLANASDSKLDRISIRDSEGNDLSLTKKKQAKKVCLQQVRLFYYKKHVPAYAAFNSINWKVVMLDEGDVIRNESGYNLVMTLLAARSQYRIFSSGTSFNNAVRELDNYLAYFRPRGTSPVIDEFLNKSRKNKKPLKYALEGLWMSGKQLRLLSKDQKAEDVMYVRLVLDYSNVDVTGMNKTQLEKLKTKQRKVRKAKEEGALALPAHLLLKVFAIRRTFDEVFPEKARKRHIENIHVPMGPDQEEVYDQVESMNFGKDYLNTKELRLLQVGTHWAVAKFSKIDEETGARIANTDFDFNLELKDKNGKIIPTRKMQVLLAKIKELETKQEFIGDKALILIQSVSLLRNILEPFFDQNGYKGRYTTFAGDMADKDKTLAKETLHNDKNCLFMIMVQKSAVGHNLACANHVYVLEHQYNPSTEEQAWARVDRLGQTKTIWIHRLISTFQDMKKGLTADQRVIAKALKKREDKKNFDEGKWQDQFKVKQVGEDGEEIQLINDEESNSNERLTSADLDGDSSEDSEMADQDEEEEEEEEEDGLSQDINELADILGNDSS